MVDIEKQENTDNSQEQNKGKITEEKKEDDKKQENTDYLKELETEITPTETKEHDKKLLHTMEIPNVPLPQFKNEKEKKEYFKKLKKDYKSKVKTHFWDYRIKRILGIRGKIDQELTEFEKNLVMKKTWFEIIAGTLLGRYYMYMGIISKDGDLKIKKVPIREAYLKYKKGVYDIDTANMLRHRGRVMNIYFEDNPHPITFDSKQNTPLVNSESLHGMFEARLIKQLFHEGMSTSTMLLSAGVVIAIGMAITIVVASIGGTVETLKDAPIIIPFIKNLWRNK